MKIYTVSNGKDYFEEFYSLSDAKAAMKESPDRKGLITKVYSNGEWVNCGEIQLKGSNKTFVANTRQKSKSYC